jgi:poly(A) polymerase/tRNA nucleotidyltransferase (CCA-adding enzyme)
MEKFPIPDFVINVAEALRGAGFEAYLIGGCVRDLLMRKTPKDWDLTTNARPEQIQAIFPNSFYENTFGTVGIKIKYHEGTPKETTEVVEVTTYRTESDYTDNRRPDNVSFADTLEEDLQRRDFTMNAIAIAISHNQLSTFDERLLIDPCHGCQDIENKTIRAVGNPNDRFGEDALRMMRAVRFSCELGFAIEKQTLEAIRTHSEKLQTIARERIRTEFERIMLSNRPAEGIQMLEKTSLLKHIIPELREGIDVSQNLHHIYTVWEHNLLALKTCPSKKLSVRLAALLHDVGKPRTKRGDGKRATFYNHDHVGARMTREILSRMTFPKEIVDHATLLVDNHLFYYNVDEVTEAAVRRVVARVGKENIKDLIDVRIGDRLGSGVPKAKPYRLRHFEYMVEKVINDPISVKELAVNGRDLMEGISLRPGPKIGAILDVLLGEVIEDASRNTREFLLHRAEELNREDIDSLRKTALNRIEKQRQKDDEEMKRKYWVK